MKRPILPHPFAAGCLVLCAATAARADVTPSGDYHTSIPIEVPTLRGVAPSVALSYAANAPNGIAGVGWSLDASSVIARTGPRGGLPITAAAPDGFELDGEPLIACATASTSPSCSSAVTAFGSAVGYYSTRRESFGRIHFDATANTWTTWTTGGQTSRYITRDGGQRWILDRKTDRHGNAMQYGYNCVPGTECELTSIRYGDATVTGAEVRFFYEPRPDVTTRSNGATILTAGTRLKSIRIMVAGQLARAYGLTYTTGAARSMLQAVTQYASDASVDPTGTISAGPTPPLPATTFQPGGGNTSFRVATVTSPGMFAIGDLPRKPSPPRFVQTLVKNLA